MLLELEVADAVQEIIPLTLEGLITVSRLYVNIIRVRCCLVVGLPYLQLKVVNARGEAVPFRPNIMGGRPKHFESTRRLLISFGGIKRLLGARVRSNHSQQDTSTKAYLDATEAQRQETRRVGALETTTHEP